MITAYLAIDTLLPTDGTQSVQTCVPTQSVGTSGSAER